MKIQGIILPLLLAGFSCNWIYSAEEKMVRIGIGSNVSGIYMKISQNIKGTSADRIVWQGDIKRSQEARTIVTLPANHKLRISIYAGGSYAGTAYIEPEALKKLAFIDVKTDIKYFYNYDYTLTFTDGTVQGPLRFEKLKK